MRAIELTSLHEFIDRSKYCIHPRIDSLNVKVDECDYDGIATLSSFDRVSRRIYLCIQRHRKDSRNTHSAHRTLCSHLIDLENIYVAFILGCVFTPPPPALFTLISYFFFITQYGFLPYFTLAAFKGLLCLCCVTLSTLLNKNGDKARIKQSGKYCFTFSHFSCDFRPCCTWYNCWILSWRVTTLSHISTPLQPVAITPVSTGCAKSTMCFPTSKLYAWYRTHWIYWSHFNVVISRTAPLGDIYIYITG